MCVKIPGTNLHGIELVTMLGVLYGNSEDKLVILENIDDIHIQPAFKALDKIDVEVNMEKNVDPLYISIELFL